MNSMGSFINFIAHLKLAAWEAKFWLLFNALGIGAYCLIDAWMFAPRIPEETFNSVDLMCFWLTMQFPLLCLYFGVNLTWIAMSPAGPFFKSRPFLIWIIGCSAWIILLLLDPIAVNQAWMFLTINGGFGKS